MGTRMEWDTEDRESYLRNAPDILCDLRQVTQPLSLSFVICKVSLIKLANIIETLQSLAN